MDQKILDTIASIKPADKNIMDEAKKRQAILAKPPGSLGMLEEISIRIAGMTGKIHNKADKCRIITLCADNGVCDEGVSCAPQSVTWAQTVNLTRGLTGASSLAKHFGDEIRVVDVGVMRDIGTPEVIDRKIRYGTNNFYKEPAMTREEAERAVLVGIEMADIAASEGVQVLGVGEMGIGNTTTSSAILSVFTNLPAEITAGKGGGLLPENYKHKIDVINESIEKYKPNPDDPIDVLSKVGGLDIAAMAGVFLGAAKNRIPVVIDGFISICAALTAYKFCENARDYMLGSHCSFEPGFKKAEEMLNIKAPLDMGMRLGEGSGCPVMFRVIDAALAVMNEMATFEEAKINDDYLTEIRKGDNFTVKR